MAKRIYVTRSLPQPVIDRLTDANFDVEVYPEDQVIPRSVLLDKAGGRDGILCILTDFIDREVLERADQAKIIANYAVGFNNIDLEEATRRRIAITNTPGVLTDATADLAWSLLMATARRIVESDNYLRAGKFEGWGPLHFLGQDITGTTLGVIGLGRIGQAFARRGAAFGMNILYYSNRRNTEFEESYPHTAEHVSLEELLQKSDYVSIHVPMTPDTIHMIGERELRMMQPHAILINTARGPIVDEEALVQALKNQWIWGAGLDVYEEEPKVHPELIPLPNAVLCPHIGSATTSTRTRMGLMAADNIIAYFEGRRPPNLLNPEVWEQGS